MKKKGSLTVLVLTLSLDVKCRKISPIVGDRNYKDLLTEANELMQQSAEKERIGDLQAALICCNQANSECFSLSTR